MEHDGYFSAEEQVTSDPEEEKEDKMVWEQVCFSLSDLEVKGCHVLRISLFLFQCADELQSVRIEEEIQCSEETEDPEKWELSVNVCVFPSMYSKYARFRA